MKKINLGIVIVHFGNKNDTLECLGSVAKLERKNIIINIYLIDNDPRNRLYNNDLSPKLNIKLLNNQKNSGFGAGINLGAKKALAGNADYVLLLNNDVVVEKTILTDLLPYFKKSDIGLISPMITYYDNPELIWCVDGHLNKQFLFSNYPHMNKHIKKVELPLFIESDFGAACLLVKASVFKKIGFLDERYFLNAEDIEWCYRAKKSGFKIIYVSKPLARHKVSASSGIRGTNILSPGNAFFYARNFFILLRDHKKSFNLFTAIIGQSFIRLPFYVVFRCNSTKAVYEYFRGYLYGWVYLLTGRLFSW